MGENLTKYLSSALVEFKKVGMKQKIVIIAILIVCFAVGIAAPSAYQKLTYNVNPTPTPSPAPIPIPATLSLSINQPSITAGATFSATINIDSPNQGIEAADFVLDFDPNYLSVATISAGNYFGLYPIKSISSDSAKISGLANLVNNKFIIPIGKGSAGTIMFNALQATSSTAIRFDKVKTIVASGGKNILDVSTLKNLDIAIQ